jgi:hypothetical protein
VEPPQSVGIDIEGNGTLICSATGMPPPKISWRQGDGRPLTPGGRFTQQPSGNLAISGRCGPAMSEHGSLYPMSKKS